jgi:hypothetical protein
MTIFLTDGIDGPFLRDGEGGDFLIEGTDVANPQLYPIPKGEWVRVAAGVVAGAVLPLNKKALYMQTIRDANDTAPVDGVWDEGKELPYEGATISDSQARDVYVAVRGNDDGVIRVDL